MELGLRLQSLILKEIGLMQNKLSWCITKHRQGSSVRLYDCMRQNAFAFRGIVNYAPTAYVCNASQHAVHHYNTESTGEIITVSDVLNSLFINKRRAQKLKIGVRRDPVCFWNSELQFIAAGDSKALPG